MHLFYKQFKKTNILYTIVPDNYVSTFENFIDFFKNYTLEEINNMSIYTKEHALHVLAISEGTYVPVYKVQLPTDITEENDILTLFRMAPHFEASEKTAMDGLENEIIMDMTVIDFVAFHAKFDNTKELIDEHI